MLKGVERKEAEKELELAQMMVKDLQKLWASYAKKALAAKQERELKQEKKGFLDFATREELDDGWGYAMFDEETYRRGIEYFEDLQKPPELSIVEQHRKNIKFSLDRWKGTVNELHRELSVEETSVQENAFEKRERELRDERWQEMRKNEVLHGY